MHEYSPTFSADGLKIAYSSWNPPGSDNPTHDIYVSNADGSGRTNLTNTDNAHEYYPSWSPNGQKIAYSRYSFSSPSSSYDIWTMNSDGSNQSLVVALAGEDYFASWSPDGSQLAFSARYGSGGGDWEIFKMNAVGSAAVVNLTANVGIDDLYGSWGGDGIAPVLTLPADDISVEATEASGAAVTFEASAADYVDGPLPVSCTPASGSTFAIGTTTVNCEATDQAGNKATGSFNVKVVHDFDGFYQPVDNNGVYNSVNAGRAVPIKFSLGGYMGMDVLSSVNPPSVKTLPKEPGITVDAIEQTVSATTSGLSYDETTGQYTYVWKTDKAWVGQDKQLTITLADGTEHLALFRFAK
jgi:dipeptidyl aminopeptidase/acylaminoacyl peptidase